MPSVKRAQRAPRALSARQLPHRASLDHTARHQGSRPAHSARLASSRVTHRRRRATTAPLAVLILRLEPRTVVSFAMPFSAFLLLILRMRPAVFTDLCVEGSSAPQPCPGGTHANQTVLSIEGFLSSLDQCVVCPAGTACSVGTNKPADCLPGSYSGAARKEKCDLCPAGKFTGTSGNTACDDCTPGCALSGSNSDHLYQHSLPLDVSALTAARTASRSQTYAWKDRALHSPAAAAHMPTRRS
jgi:hypothetical protein